MKSTFANRIPSFCWAALLIAPLMMAGEPGGPHQAAGSQIGYESIGQVLNNGAQSLQYGYLNYVRGLPRIATSSAVSEATALLTFYNDTANESVTNNGPIRVINRTGTGKIYFDNTGFATFSNPDTFRDGTAVQTCNLRHQVVLDTSTGYFTVTFEMEITDVHKFEIDGHTYQMGQPGDVYRVSVSGTLASSAPPTAYIAGVAAGLGAEVEEHGK